MALVHDEVPKHPVRVYQGDGLGVFTSEIQFPAETDVKFAETVLEWFTEGGFDQLFIIDGIVSPDLGEKDSGDIHGVAATEEGRNRLRAAGIEPMQQGIVSGIAGWLLSEADRIGGRRHMVILLGKKRAGQVYTVMLVFMYLWIIGAVAAGYMPVFALVALLTLPLARTAIRGALRDYDDPQKFIPAQGANVMVNLLTQTLLAAGFLLGFLAA